jgi:ribosomal protein L44E
MDTARSFIACTDSDFPKEIRPPCPSCGENHAQSNSDRWICAECGKQWGKNPRPRVANNPPCVFCGGRTHKQSMNYVCTECGKSIRRYKVET